MFDGEAFGKEMVEIVREYLAGELEAILAENKALTEANAAMVERIKALEDREMPPVLKGDQGDPGEVDMAEVERLIGEAVDRAVGAIPAAEPGAPGRDVDMDEVGKRIDAAVKAAVDAIPAAKAGEPGKDGLGLANALIDRAGCLVVTFTDGSDKNLGQVVGKDGEPGKDGETFTLDDFDIEQIDERSISLKFTRGAACHSFELAFAVPIDRGVWSEAKAAEYVRGDAVTWAGSLWIAQKDAPGKPDTADGGWRLAVKRGRDGKDAR